ncbi:hypothetical protein PR003_g27641 [Phytophthora rubi]|uniref:Uncharacterized protein n=1 Tax=Phytophthora rubi TaxID=129364 RepID=A0A6A3I9R1_9STRA|nr:hypothetical protein PR001_g24519 [Phytophthora rubi]KAE9007401.1 hypothetical protein PR002_g16214 [Phytophthora rubi]KAE9281574.1 hypothetical protein PR003_g27641 [Phytophthora rubi]
MTTAPGGLLPADKSLHGSVTFRTGPRANGPRKGIVKQFTFVAGAGFSVARAQALRFLSGDEFTPDPEVIEDQNLFMKATKNARQQDFKEVTESNFWELLKRRWACITDNDILTMASSELPIYDQFTFEFYIYLAPAQRATEGLRRATADRVRAAAAEIAAIQEREGRRFGPIASHHLAVHVARQPEGAPISVPNDNTTQQAIALDRAAAALSVEHDEIEEDAVEIEVELFGAWVKVRVKRSTLRTALRLPQHDIVSRGIFHGFQPEAMMPQGTDVPDSDHAAPANDE